MSGSWLTQLSSSRSSGGIGADAEVVGCEAAARVYLRCTLGGLIEDNPRTHDIRRTTRIYLDEGRKNDDANAPTNDRFSIGPRIQEANDESCRMTSRWSC